MTEGKSLQEIHNPDGVCFGCGSTNPEGLHLRSFLGDGAVVAEWMPGPNHRSFPGVLNGGIIGTLLDCHSNWAAVVALLESTGEFGMTVTANYAVTLLRPTPTDRPVQLRSWVTNLEGRRATVAASLSSGGEICATSEGTFVRPRVPFGN
jgi:acyl-coenzyme A thioesterase PaaI-like protein